MNFTKRNRFSLARLFLVAAIIGLLAVFVMPAYADIYSTKALAFTNSAISSTNGPFYGTTTTNLNTTTTAAVTLTITSDPIPIRQGWGLALLPQVTGTNAAATELMTNYFDAGVLVGGSGGTTNWTTTHPIKTVTALNGTNAVSDLSVVDKSTLNNIAFLRWSSCTIGAGHTNVITLSQMLYSYSLYAN
jgi:Tfp pilus assembly protein FimT